MNEMNPANVNVMEQPQPAISAPEGHPWMEQMQVPVVGELAVSAVVYGAMSDAFNAQRGTMEVRGMDEANAILQQALFTDEEPADSSVAWAVNVLNKNDQSRADYIQANYAEFAAHMLQEQQQRTREALAAQEEEVITLPSGRIVKRKKNSNVLYPTFGDKDASITSQGMPEQLAS